MPLWISMDYIIDDVIRSKKMSKVSIAIAPSIFTLGHPSKAQNATKTPGYFSDLTAGITSGRKVCCDLTIAAILLKITISNTAPI